MGTLGILGAVWLSSYVALVVTGCRAINNAPKQPLNGNAILVVAMTFALLPVVTGFVGYVSVWYSGGGPIISMFAALPSAMVGYLLANTTLYRMVTKMFS